MSTACGGGLLASLAQVPDPRGRKGRRHELSAMLTAVICGMLCGVRGYEALVEWLHDQTVDVWHWMGYTRKPPKKDCFRDLLMRLDPDSLERVLREWITQHLKLSDAPETLAGVSLDGKTLCGTLRPFERAVHLLAAVDHQTGYVLSQCRVDEKTNEHKAALELLKDMVLKGRVIVADAMFCQRDVCRQIVDSGGDYLVSVKENQPGLLREITQEFTAEAAVFSPWQQRQRESDTQRVSCSDKGHGRRERRTLTSTIALNQHLDWPGVKQVCRVVRERILRGQRQTETAYFITSLSRRQADASRLEQLIRGHWGAIENGLHWVRDVTLGEDRCTICRGHAPQNLAACRNTALNWLRRNGGGNLASRIRSFTRNSLRLFTKLGFVK